MESLLPRTGKEPAINAGRKGHATAKDAREAAPPRNYQLDYKVKTKSQNIRAIKKEAVLLRRYRLWLAKQECKLATTIMGRLQCDGFEKGRRILIEAKCEISREKIRMAVGQLLDYGFQIQKKFGKTHMAILLPEKPASDLIDWLDPLGIRVIWRDKAAFLDNANGRFT